MIRQTNKHSNRDYNFICINIYFEIVFFLNPWFVLQATDLKWIDSDELFLEMNVFTYFVL